MSTFGWCETGAHEGRKLKWQTPCKGRYRLTVKETRKQGRKQIEVVIKDEERVCDCWCHTPGGQRPKTQKPKTKRRRK